MEKYQMFKSFIQKVKHFTLNFSIICREKMSCPICNHNNVTILYTIPVSYGVNNTEIFNVVQCLGCKLAYLSPFPKDELLSKSYEAGYHKQKENFINEFLCYLSIRLAIKELRKFKLIGKVLDIGCGRGAFLKEMQKAGYDSYGVESSHEGYEICSKIKDLKVTNCRITDCQLDDSYFDIITMWHSLEHMSEPNILLKKIKRLLSPKGILIIEVPNFSCLESRIFKKNWHHLDIPRHLFFYNKSSLLRLLRLNNFKTLKVVTESYSVFPLSPIKSYFLSLKNKNSLVWSLLIFLSPIVIILSVLRIFPLINFRSCVRIYAKAYKGDEF